jgi:hypothetical protein
MREIPLLQVLCLRSVGPQSCSAEATFAPSQKDEQGVISDASSSAASRLLRSFHHNKNKDHKLSRSPCIGTGSARRVNANDVDIFHPLGSERVRDSIRPSADSTTLASSPSYSEQLVYIHGNPATDCLQSLIDSLVELGRMDDQRMGLHFFQEWRQNVILAGAASKADGGGDPLLLQETASPTASSKKKRRREQEAPAATLALGALSLYNCNIALSTFESMKEAKIGPHVATLDLTGIRGLTNELLSLLLPDCPNLQHLSLKNCRRLTNLTLVGKHQKQLTTLDIGGCFNVTTDHVLQMVPLLPRMNRLHASGLGWNDESMGDLVASRNWQHLSLCFTLSLTQGALRKNILPLASTLTCIALAFCETVIDNAAMGLLGRNLPLVKAMDLRGNPALTTLTGWYDGRVSANLPIQSLTVVGRYSGLSEAGVEETRRIHPSETAGLIVILDGGGMGAAVLAET